MSTERPGPTTEAPTKPQEVNPTTYIRKENNDCLFERFRVLERPRARRPRRRRVGVIQTTNRGMGRGALAPLPMLVLALVAALILTVRIEEWRLAAQRRRSAAALLVTSNESAARDTTRDVALENSRVATLLGDSLRLVEKQVVQVSQKRDALDRALGRERVARYSATAVVDSLERVVAARDSLVGNTTAERRVATFHVRQEPYTIDAEVESLGAAHAKLGMNPIAKACHRRRIPRRCE